MGRRDLVERIKESVDIVDVVSEFVSLRRSGRRYSGLCPFHAEKTPSFFVNPDEQFFYCFGCGSGGDAIAFVMKIRGLNFLDAVKYLADRYNVPIDDLRHGDSQDGQLLKLYFDLIRQAETFYHELLLYDAKGKLALDYLIRRGINEDIIKRQKLGYAPDEWDALYRHFLANSVDIENAKVVGLFSVSSRGSIFDRFRNRVIFPIRDARGATVAFGGRSLDNSEPKYLNSPETPIYKKRSLLYQYDIALDACRKAGKSGFVYLVEGYMDALAFHRSGEYRVVATLGTAFTVQQARLLRRLADEVILVYDGDLAGRKAMARIFPFLLKEGLKATCVPLPEGMDPDDFLREKGIEEFEDLVEERLDLARFVIDEYVKDWDGTDTGKLQVLSELYPVFKEITDPLVFREYVELISEKLKVPSEAVVDQFQVWSRKTRFSSGKKKTISRLSHLVSGSPEEELVRIFLRYPHFLSKVEGMFEEMVEHMTKPLALVISALYHRWKDNPDSDVDIREIYDRIDDNAAKEIMARFSVEEDKYPDEKVAEVFLDDYVAAFRKKSKVLSRQRIKQQLCEAEKKGDLDSVKILLSQLKAIGAD